MTQNHPSQRFRLAVHFGVCHWALLTTIQWENFWYYLSAGSEREASFISFAMTVPWLQTQNLIAAGALGLLTYLAGTRACMRWPFFGFYSILTVYLLFNQIHYRILFDNFRLSSMTDGADYVDLGLIWASVKGQFDFAFFLKAAFGAVALVWLGWRFLVRQAPPCSVHPWPWYASGNVRATVAVLFLAGSPTIVSAKYFNLQIHPVYTLVTDAWIAGLRARVRAAEDAVDVATLPGPEGEISIDPRLSEAADAIRKRAPRPNIILIVLESVGADQLLTDSGRPSPVDAPNLAKLCDHAMIFDSVYSVYPATAQAHIALNTGGRHQTCTPIQEVLRHEFNGPTLPRVFQDQGYSTALISSQHLAFGGMDRCLQKVGYQTFDDFGADPGSNNPDNCLDGWDAKEEYTVAKIERWIKKHASSERPFLVNFLTSATHHPYLQTPGYQGPHPPNDKLAKYRNSLHYTDACLMQLVNFLKDNALLDNTIIAITGDHGEAFGNIHPGVTLHGNFLYEECIRSFLIIAHPAIPGALISRRVGSSGDIAPTLAALANLPPPDMPGKNLLPREYPPRFVFFYKLMYPEKWGLRDGRWKFLQSIRDSKSQLFDLVDDPLEQRNLADGDPQRVKNYQYRCQDWYCRTDKEFTAYLTGFGPLRTKTLSVKDLQSPGPKSLCVGEQIKDKGGVNSSGVDEGFMPRQSFPTSRVPVACTTWLAYPGRKTVSFWWHAPSGACFKKDELVDHFWGASNPIVMSPFPGPLPLEVGSWEVRITDDLFKLLIKARFEVQPE